MTSGQRRGILPSAETQVLINYMHGDIARRLAQGQAARGVEPATAARHGTDQAAALLSWVFFIAPVMGVFTLGALGSLGAMILVAPLDLIGILILIRIHTAMVRPANRKLVYAIPTWLLVVTGGAYVAGLFLLMIFVLLTS